MPIRLTSVIEIEPGGFGSNLCPEVQSIGFAVYPRKKTKVMGHHHHQDYWEIHYLVRGQMAEWIAGEQRIIRAGELFVMPPGIPHGGPDLVLHRSEMFFIGFRLEPEHALKGLEPAAASELVAGFQAMRPEPFASEPGLIEGFAALLNEGQGSGPLVAAACRSHLHRILIDVVRSWRAQVRPAGSSSPYTRHVEAAVGLMRERLAASMRIDSLARAVGLGRSTLHERFVAETGLSPSEFHRRLRIERAKELLPKVGNTEVAYALGFATPQHFGTAFKRATGVTPGQWRQRAAKA